MTSDDHISALERLAKLKEAGSLSDQEFEAQKARLFSEVERPTKGAPMLRRLWLVVTLTVLLLTFPLALLILLTGPVYRHRDGHWQPISAAGRWVYAGALGLWLVAAIGYGAMHPEAYRESAVEGSRTARTGKPDEGQPLGCEGQDVADMVKSAVENNATSRLVQVRIIDFGNAREVFYDPQDRARYCRADAELNTGGHAVSYKLYFGPSGGQMVEVREGEDAFNALTMVEVAKLMATQRAEAAKQAAGQNSQVTTNAGTGGAAQCKIPNIAKDTKYAELRPTLLAQGFRPAPPPASEGSYCGSERSNGETCKAMPEIEDCSAGGYCKMTFSGPGITKLEITIFGDGPADTDATVQGSSGRCE